MIHFVHLQVCETTVILQLKIQLQKFRRFRHAFKTDKYLTLVQWEEIESYLVKKAKCIVKGLNVPPDTYKTDDGNLSISFNVLSKNECYIDLEKLNFECYSDFMLQATIAKLPSKSGAHKKVVKIPSTLYTQSSDAVSDDPHSKPNLNGVALEYNPSEQFAQRHQTSHYVPSSKANDSSENNKSQVEYSPQRVNSDKNGKGSSKDVQKYTPSRIRPNGNQDENSKQNTSSLKSDLFGKDSDEDADVVLNSDEENFQVTDRKKSPSSPKIPETSKTRPKRQLVDSDTESRKLEARKANKKVKSDGSSSNQPKIDSMLPHLENTTYVTQRKRLKLPKNKSTSKMSRSILPVDIPAVLDLIDTPTMDRLNKFVEEIDEEEDRNNQRKEELRDFEMLNCNEKTNEELKK